VWEFFSERLTLEPWSPGGSVAVDVEVVPETPAAPLA